MFWVDGSSPAGEEGPGSPTPSTPMADADSGRAFCIHGELVGGRSWRAQSPPWGLISFNVPIRGFRSSVVVRLAPVGVWFLSRPQAHRLPRSLVALLTRLPVCFFVGNHKVPGILGRVGGEIDPVECRFVTAALFWFAVRKVTCFSVDLEAIFGASNIAELGWNTMFV